MTEYHLLPETMIQALGWMLLHSTWQGLAVAALLGAARTVSTSPRIRYASACVALLAIVALAAGTMWLQAGPSAPVAPAPHDAAAQPGVTEPLPAPMLGTDAAPRDVAASLAPEAWAATATTLQRHLPRLVLAWLAGVLILSVRLLGGGWACRRLRRRGIGPLPADLGARARALGRRLRIREGVDVATSTVAQVPMVVGVLRPVVLIPVATVTGLSPVQLEAILLHELAHVRRHDNLVNLLQRFVEILFFYHPAVWWVSACIRTEREHCCDDIAVAGQDPKLYAGALTALEGLRGPQLAVAATDGSLLARVRRLLAPPASTRHERSPVAASGLLVALLVVAATVITLGRTEAAVESEETTMSTKSRVLDVQPLRAFTRAVGSVYTTLHMAGASEWSSARLMGVLGNAFSFEMRAGGGQVWQEANLEWWQHLPALEVGVPMRRFEGSGDGKDPAVMAAAWDAVRASIDAGVPAVALCPMGPDPNSARDWGLLVGYDEAGQTYAIRRHNLELTYRYDEIGSDHGDYCVLVYDPSISSDQRAIDVAALKNAVAFAHGTRFPSQVDPYPVDARGLAAFEMWRDAIATAAPIKEHERGPHSGGIVDDSRYNSVELRELSKYAAAYCRELAEAFPEAATPLETAASDYDGVVGAAAGLALLFQEAPDGNTLSPEVRTKAAKLIDAALHGERRAIGQIEAALALIDAP